MEKIVARVRQAIDDKQYDAVKMRFACRITKPRIRTHTRNVQYLLLVHGNSGSLEAPPVKIYILRLPVFADYLRTRNVFYHNSYFIFHLENYSSFLPNFDIN
jgi:hypothetical protein